MIIHNKLVRDEIPQIIEADGRHGVCRILNDEEYLAALEKKLSEEVAEYLADQNLEEMSDILEVLYALCQARGYSTEELEACRREKAEKRGGFAKKLFLEYVE